jgi:hypothetical protein
VRSTKVGGGKGGGGFRDGAGGRQERGSTETHARVHLHKARGTAAEQRGVSFVLVTCAGRCAERRDRSGARSNQHSSGSDDGKFRRKSFPLLLACLISS